MNESERAFVGEVLGDDLGVAVLETFTPAAFPFLVVLEVDGFRLHPLGPGDRVYLRNIREEDLLIIDLLDDLYSRSQLSELEATEGGGR